MPQDTQANRKFKIYMLYNDGQDKVYIGSTCRNIRKRLNEHNSKKGGTMSRLMKGGGRLKATILEDDISLEDRDNREKYWIEKMKDKCVNKQIPQNINAQNSQEYHKEYRQKNYEKLRQKDKEYYEANKPYLLERNRRYKRRIGKARISEMWKNYYSRKKDWINRRVKCECGVELNNNCLQRHKRSKKHREKMRELGIDKENIIVIDELPLEPLDINIPNLINNIRLD